MGMKRKFLLCSIIIVFCIFAGCAPQSGKPEDTEQPLELYQVDESVVAPEWKDSFLAAPKEEGDLRIIQISDPHYYSMSITDQGVLYQNAMAKAAGRDALHIGEILDAFYEQVQEEEPEKQEEPSDTHQHDMQWTVLKKPTLTEDGKEITE